MLTLKSWILLVFVHVSLGGIPARADEWQRLAEQISCVNYSDFLYNRPPRNFGEADSPRLNALQDAMAIPADLPELKKRAEHADSKIRALALMKLYISRDPNAFRVIHSRLGDEGLAFPSQSTFVSNIYFDSDQRKFVSLKIETQDQGWDRARAMAALLELRADRELKFVVDWFYGTEPISNGTTDQMAFITEYHRRRPADWRKSMTALVAHPGFDAMETMSLIYLALMINDFHGEI